MKPKSNYVMVLPNGWAFLLWSIALATLFVFQSTSDVSLNKVLFAIYFFSAALISIHHIRSDANNPTNRRLSGTYLPLVTASFIFIILLIYGFSESQIRDSFPYLFVALAPVLGIAIGRNLGTRYLLGTAVLLSLVASTLSFVDWVARRGATDVLSKVGLSSGALPAFGMAIAAWAAFYVRGRTRAALLFATAIILGLMLGTGTRTNLVFLLFLLPFLFSDRKFFERPGLYIKFVRKRISSVVGLILLISVSLFGLASLFGLTSLFQRRFFELTDAFLQDPTNDQSFVLRGIYYQEGQRIFLENPLLGMGFSPFGTSIVLDTPFEGLAKIGLLGNALLLLVVMGTYFNLRKAVSAETLPILRGVQGWLFVLIALVPFGTIWQDKGLPIALILAYALIESHSNKNEFNLEPPQNPIQLGLRTG